MRCILTSPALRALLKRDAARRFTINSGIRIIGVSEAMYQDALRELAGEASSVLACILPIFGQACIGVSSGGESIQMAAQSRLDMTKWTVTVATDGTNAFGLVWPRLILASIKKAIALIDSDERVKARMRDATVDPGRAKEVLRLVADDLVWTRVHGLECISIIEGSVRRWTTWCGVTQGGLFSAHQYALAKAMKVDMVLMQVVENMVARNIMDDQLMQATVESAEQARKVCQWMWALAVIFGDEVGDLAGLLSAGQVDEEGAMRDAEDEQDWSHLGLPGAIGKLNFGKFKVLQHPDAIGTEFDMARFIGEMPAQWVDTDGVSVCKRPAVVRDAIEFNGIAIGFDDAALEAHALNEVEITVERANNLNSLIPVIGAQASEIFGRSCFKASSVLLHLMRGVTPSVNARAMERATHVQLALFRNVMGVSSELVCGAMEEWSGRCSKKAAEQRCSLSVHLPASNGPGAGWSECRLIYKLAHCSKCIDTYPAIASMADMRDYPPPHTWETCAVRALREAAATIRELVSISAFHEPPPGDPTQWQYVYDRLVGPGRTILWRNIPLLAGRHFQKVAARAHATELLLRTLDDPSVPTLTKVRLTSACQPGAGAIFSVASLVNEHVLLTTMEMRMATWHLIGHPVPAIIGDTRCVCALYDEHGLPRVPGPVGKGGRLLTEREHELGAHWMQCLKQGMSTQGHNAVSHAWKRMTHRLGYRSEVLEVKLGVNDRGVEQWGDGTCTNFNVETIVWVWDSRICNVYAFGMRTKASKHVWAVTDAAEEQKTRAKESACDKYMQGRCKFLPVAVHTLGGLGRQAAAWLEEKYQHKIDALQDPQQKRMAALEKQWALQEIACAVARRNCMIFLANASPIAGGDAPQASDGLEHDAEASRQVRGMEGAGE